LNNSRSFLERSLARFTSVLQESVFAEETVSRNGWLQAMDPRVKVYGTLLLILCSSFSHEALSVISIYLLSLVLAFGSKVFSMSFVRRVWIFMPLYTTLIALPALFMTPGTPWITFPGALTISRQGALVAFFLVLRVATSVSFMFLLVLTTSWPSLLKALRSLGFPQLLVFLLAMTYRYIYVLLHTANSLFLARKSRKVGAEAWQSTRQWIGVLLGTLLGKSYHLSSEVYLAMQSRGFRREPVILSDFRIKSSDAVWLVFFTMFGCIAFYFGYWRHS